MVFVSTFSTERGLVLSHVSNYDPSLCFLYEEVH